MIVVVVIDNSVESYYKVSQDTLVYRSTITGLITFCNTIGNIFSPELITENEAMATQSNRNNWRVFSYTSNQVLRNVIF